MGDKARERIRDMGPRRWCGKGYTGSFLQKVKQCQSFCMPTCCIPLQGRPEDWEAWKKLFTLGLTPPSMEVSFWIYWKTQQTSLFLLCQKNQTPKAPLRQGILILFQLTNLIDTQYLWVVRDTKLAKRWQKRSCVSDPAMWAIYSVGRADFLMNSHADLQVEAEDSWSARRL